MNKITRIILTYFILAWSFSIHAGPTIGAKAEYIFEDAGDRVPLGIADDGKVIIMGGLGDDVEPWIEIYDRKIGRNKRLLFNEDGSRKIVTPTAVSLDDSGRKMAFVDGNGIGVYDFASEKMTFYPDRRFGFDSFYLFSPQWLNDDELAFIDNRGWRSVLIFGLKTKALRILKPPTGKFIGDFSVAPGGRLVLTLGDASSNVVLGKFSTKSFLIDEAAAPGINIYTLTLEKPEFEQLTFGKWFSDFPKMSPTGRHLVYLQGREFRIGRGATLSLLDLKDRKSYKITSNDLTQIVFSFQWVDKNEIAFVKPHNGAASIFLYDVVTHKESEAYKAKGKFDSFTYSSTRREFALIEERGDKKVLTVVPMGHVPED